MNVILIKIIIAILLLMILLLSIFSINILLDNKIESWFFDSKQNETTPLKKNQANKQLTIEESHQKRGERIKALKELGKDLSGKTDQ